MSINSDSFTQRNTSGLVLFKHAMFTFYLNIAAVELGIFATHTHLRYATMLFPSETSKYNTIGEIGRFSVKQRITQTVLPGTPSE